MALRPTLQQLRLFEAVARTGSYTRAAEQVFLSQPAVSIQVKRLEDAVGMPLFETVGKRLQLTLAGQELYAASRDILGRLQAVEEALEDMKGEVAGPLRLAVVTTAKYFLPHYLGAFLRRYPKVLPQLKVTNRERVLERLTDNLDDIYVLGQLPEGIELEAQPFLDDELVVFAHPDHPLARERNIPLKRLARERLLFREQGSGIRMAQEAFFAEKGVAIEPYMELGSGEAIKQGVMAGIGLGMLSTYSLRMELDTGRLVILDVEGLPIRRSWNAVYPRGKKPSLVAQKFLDFLVKTPLERL